jgi:hypothetical protein
MATGWLPGDSAPRVRPQRKPAHALAYGPCARVKSVQTPLADLKCLTALQEKGRARPRTGMAVCTMPQGPSVSICSLASASSTLASASSEWRSCATTHPQRQPGTCKVPRQTLLSAQRVQPRVLLRHWKVWIPRYTVV